MKINCHTQTRTRPEFWFPVRSGTGFGGIWAGTGSGPVAVDLAGTTPQFFSCCIIGFMMSYLHHVPPPVPWLDHVLPYSSNTASRALLQFPGCITCVVLPSSSQTVSRATLEFTQCIMAPPPPFCDTWRGKFSNSKSKLHIYIG